MSARGVSHGIDVFTVKEPYADQNEGSRTEEEPDGMWMSKH